MKKIFRLSLGLLFIAGLTIFSSFTKKEVLVIPVAAPSIVVNKVGSPFEKKFGLTMKRTDLYVYHWFDYQEWHDVGDWQWNRDNTVDDECNWTGCDAMYTRAPTHPYEMGYASFYCHTDEWTGLPTVNTGCATYWSYMLVYHY